MTGARTRRAAEAAIDAAGGLCSQGGLQDALGLSKAWMAELVRRPTFPPPLQLREGKGKTRNVWLYAEVLDWMVMQGFPRWKPPANEEEEAA